MQITNIKVVFGGSFNPPTIAHYEISKAIIERFKVSDLVFVPTSLNYGKKTLISNKSRIEMLEIMCKDLPNSRVSDFEVIQPEYKGTYFTLKHFQGYYFVMGADNLIEIETWKNFPNVVSENKFIIFNRNNINIFGILNKESLKPYKDNFILLDDISIPDVSSSAYRKTFDKTIVLSDIHKYVLKNKLYRGENNE